MKSRHSWAEESVESSVFRGAWEIIRKLLLGKWHDWWEMVLTSMKQKIFGNCTSWYLDKCHNNYYQNDTKEYFK